MDKQELEKIKLDPNKKMAAAHVDYRDIWEGGLENYPFARARIEPLIYEIRDGSKVLDVGVNSGEFIKHLKDRKGCDVYGVDISQKLIDKCHEKGLTNTFCCDAERLPFADESFDYVTLMEVLEHFDDPTKCLKEIRRVLKKDGVFLGTCPHANLERYVWDDDRLHQQYYDEAGLEKDLKTSFETVHFRILSGAQFNLGFVNTFLAKEPCQFLFKCGGKDCEPWDEQLRNSPDITRVWWGFTQLIGVIYYRMHGFIEKMSKMGVESGHEKLAYDLQEFQMQWQDRMHSSFMQDELGGLLGIADLSVWQITSSRHTLAFLMACKDVVKKPIVTEVDDWLFDLPSYNIASNPYKANSEPEFIAYQQLQLSDYIVCSTQFIKDHLLEFFPEKQIYVVPNSIDFDLWDKKEIKDLDMYPKKEGVIRIGYTGCGNHEGDLELIKRPLKKILEENPNVEFITYNRFEALKDLPNVVYTGRWVSVNTVHEEFKRWKMDIGIAPLRHNNFNYAKSNLRWLEYSALGIPSICSNVYPFVNSVEDEKTGLICDNSDLSWYEALKKLISDAGKRAEIGRNAYKEVKKNFNMDVTAKKYANILKEIKCKGPTSKLKLEESSMIPTTTDGIQELSEVG